MFGYKGRDEVKADATAERVHFGLLLVVVFTLGLVSGLSF